MRYFQNRAHAGRLLADELLEEFRYENTIVVALSPGGVVVGEQIAAALHTVLSLLLIEPIEIPGVNKETIGMINQRGDFVHNDRLPIGLVEMLEVEFRGAIEQEKIEKIHRIHELVGQEGIVSPEAVRGHNVIVVTDGLNTGASFDAVAAYLKPIKIEKMVVAVPFATIEAVDRLHVLCDQLHVLNVISGTFDIDHYYEDEEDLSQERVMKILANVIESWQ